MLCGRSEREELFEEAGAVQEVRAVREDEPPAVLDCCRAG